MIGLAKELKSNSSQSIEAHSGFQRRSYYHLVVKNNWNLLAAVFRMSKIPFPETYAKTPFKKLDGKRPEILQYQPKKTDFKTTNVNLDHETTACHSRGIPEQLNERFLKACKANDEDGKERETEQTEQEKLELEIDISLGDTELNDLVIQYLKEHRRFFLSSFSMEISKHRLPTVPN